MGAGHNISPRLEKQLVLELKVGLDVAEGLEWFPGSFICRQAVPLDEDVPIAPPMLSTKGTLRRWKKTTIQCRR